MTTFASAFKNEIRRLARREAKAVAAPATKAVARYRREIARLKRQIADQQKTIAQLASRQFQAYDNGKAEDAEDGHRFSARSVRAQRRRTGLSAADYAKLLGVSAISVYNWETGKTRPRKSQLAALVAVRGLGKREAQQKLESLGADTRKSAPAKKGRQTKRR
jgi:DNA-binding transcriptional regulator YiaG